MRKRRLARLSALENGSPSVSLSPPVTPVPQSPISSIRISSHLVFDAPDTPVDEKCPDLITEAEKLSENADDKNESKLEGIFQVPSKPIDINMPSSSRHNRPPQRSDSETSSIHMEVDEVSGLTEKAGGNTDIDSGIENMEVSFFNSKIASCKQQRIGG